ncbi:hypothetical protein [Brachyspira innocens]|uniref:hypothetical protein n=1 Tax=Brachyspira innocens TaxID=13264 RepID=UPI000361F145|nr:hypothetical protein [Brachyspira innocens]
MNRIIIIFIFISFINSMVFAQLKEYTHLVIGPAGKDTMKSGNYSEFDVCYFDTILSLETIMNKPKLRVFDWSTGYEFDYMEYFYEISKFVYTKNIRYNYNDYKNMSDSMKAMLFVMSKNNNDPKSMYKKGFLPYYISILCAELQVNLKYYLIDWRGVYNKEFEDIILNSAKKLINLKNNKNEYIQKCLQNYYVEYMLNMADLVLNTYDEYSRINRINGYATYKTR